MSRRLTFAFLPVVLLAATAHAQTPDRRVTPTIPETQIEPARLSSPYEFLSVATSASEFVIQTSEAAGERAGSEEVKSLASELVGTHRMLMTELAAAGAQAGVDIAKPSMDGEQNGLLGKLKLVEGAEFDANYADAQIFVHQRTIAYYRGYADRQDALAAAAQRLLPTILTNYARLVELGAKFAPKDAAAN